MRRGGADGGARGDIDDRPAAGVADRRDGRAAAEEDALDVDRMDLAPEIQGGAFGRTLERRAGIVDQDMQPAEGVDRAFDDLGPAGLPAV